MRATATGDSADESSSLSIGDETVPVTIALTVRPTVQDDHPRNRESIDFSRSFDDDGDAAPAAAGGPSATGKGANDSLNLSASIDLESDSDSGPAPAGSRSSKSGTRVSPETQLVIQTREVRTLAEGTLDKSREKSASLPAPDIAPSRYDYEFLGKIGEGGMGVVYKARQGSVGREVAVKMLHPKRAADKALRDSFLSEAVVNGDLEHPNIVPVYDLGKDKNEGLFYAMKQVKGRNWDKVIGEKKQSENLEILMKVADAIAFAHSHGVVHRDLKPENVVIGDFGEVFVVDWGVARVMPGFEKASGIIGADGLWGTPAYAAPEILTGPLEAIGPHSDVYLLGALLYEIVTGYPPHYGRTVSQCKAAAKLNEIRPTELTGELVDIALKAMESEPADRYATVQSFQKAIRDYQSHSESIVLAASAKSDLDRARQSNDYKDYNRAIAVYEKALELWPENHAAQTELPEAKLAYAQAALGKGDFELGLSLADQANPAHRDVIQKLATAQAERNSRQRRLTFFRRAALVASLVAIGFAGWAEVQRQEAVKQTGIAETNATEAKRQEGIAKTNEKSANDNAIEALKQQKLAEANATEAKRQEGIAKVNEQKAIDNAAEAKKQQMLAEENAKKAQEQEMIAKANEVKANESAAEAKKQQMLAEASAREALRQEGIAKQQAAIAKYEAYVAKIGVASAKADENAFDVVRGVLSDVLKDAGKDFDLRGWEWSRLSYLSQLGQTIKLDAQAEAAAIDSRGARFVVAGQDGRAVMGRLDDAKLPTTELAAQNDGASPIQGLAFTTDDKYVAAARKNGTIALWDAATGAVVAAPALKHAQAVNSVAFTKVDGVQWMLTSSDDKTARLWRAEGAPQSWQPAGELKGHYTRVTNAVFSPKADRIVTVGDDGKAVAWQQSKSAPGAYAQLAEYIDHGCALYAAAFLPESNLVATAGVDGRVRIWDPTKIKPVNIAALLRDGAGPAERRRNSVDPGIVRQDLIAHSAPVHALNFSPDGKYLLTAADDNTVKVWKLDAPTQQFIADKTLRGHGGWVRACATTSKTSATGDLTVVSASHDKSAKIWSVAKYEEVRAVGSELMKKHDDQILAASFDKRGERIITSSRDQTARVWLINDPDKPVATLASGDDDVLKEGHRYLVSSAVYFPDGSQVVTGGIDGQAIGWDVKTGAMLWQRSGIGLNAAIAVTPGWIATGSDDQEVKLWKLESNRPSEQPVLLDGHDKNASVTALAFSPNGQLLVSGDTQGTAILWTYEGMKWVSRGRFVGHSKHINVAVFAPGRANRLLTASDDGQVLQWDVATRQQLPQRALSHEGERVIGLALTADGRSAVTVSAAPGALRDPKAVNRPHVLRQWDIENPQSVTAIRIEKTFAVLSLALSPEGKALVAVSDKSGDETAIRQWNLATRQEETPVVGKAGTKGTFWSVVFAPADAQGAQKVLTLGGNQASIWETKAGSLVMSLSPHGSVASASFSSDGKYAVTGSWDQTLKIWDIQSRRVVQKLPQPHRGRINAALFSPAAGALRILTVSNDKTAKVWKWNGPAAAPVEEFQPFAHPAEVLGAAFSPDGNSIVTACADRNARIWNLEQPGDPLVLKGHTDKVWSVAFSADGKWVATGSEDTTAIVWNAATGKQVIQPLQGHSAGITAVAFYANGERLITGSRDETARVWDPGVLKLADAGNVAAGDRPTLPQGKEILPLRGHNSALTSVSFSPNGKYALTASQDGTAILWLTQEAPGDEPKAALLSR